MELLKSEILFNPLGSALQSRGPLGGGAFCQLLATCKQYSRLVKLFIAFMLGLSAFLENTA